MSFDCLARVRLAMLPSSVSESNSAFTGVVPVVSLHVLLTNGFAWILLQPFSMHLLVSLL